ncbi:MAG: peptidylprolyl isomerase [Clostridiales bacterium]|nr:peptidylprolyl isomerase [Clostridiales bacterium]
MDGGGKIEIELYPDIAPNTVSNFIALANSGFYDGVIFHRVIPGFMIQGGDPDGTGRGGPGYRIKGEFANNGYTDNDLKHVRGVISMARQGNQANPPAAYDTAGSQFFIMVADSPYLDSDYAAFGEVVSGMDVADEIVSAQTDASDKPLKDQKIKSIRVDTFGAEYAEPETLAE